MNSISSDIDEALKKINNGKKGKVENEDDTLGFYHENDLNTIELVYLEKKGCELYGKSLEEIRAAGPEFLMEIMHPDDIVPCITKLNEFKSGLYNGEVLTYVQRLKTTFSEEYKPYFTCVKINKEKGVFQSVTSPMTQIDPFKDEVLMALEDGRQIEEYMSVYSSLSKSEKKVIGLVCLGKNVKSIAEELFRSPHTIEKHKKNIFSKTGFQSNAELMKFAIFFNLINE